MTSVVADREKVLRRLLGELPEVGSSQDADEQTRAVLSRIVRTALGKVQTGSSLSAGAFTCPNCGAPAESIKTPYCGSHCRDMAAFIRQFRSSMEDGVIFEPERQVGMGQALWSLQGGGFPRRQQLVPPKVLTKVIERHGGLCAVCGAPATEVDHTGSG